MVLFAVAYNFYSLYPEVGIQVLDLNDRVLHLAALDRASIALDLGTGFTDPWLDSIGMGYPLFHHYQHLPYLAPALVQAISMESFELSDRLIWTNYLLLALFPIPVYWGYAPLWIWPLPCCFRELDRAADSHQRLIRSGIR